MDDYTQATIFINDEYASIQKEEKVKGDKDLGGNTQVTPQVTPQVEQADISEKILLFCKAGRSKREIAEYCGYKDVKSFSNKYVKPLIEEGKLRMTIPEKPQSSKQRYVSE